MKFSEDTKKRYFAEVVKYLQREGFEVTQLMGDFLDIRYQDQDLYHLTDVSSTSYNPDSLTSHTLEEANHRSFLISRTVEQYMGEMEVAPFLNVEGVDEKFKLLADFGGTVLAAKGTPNGVHFVTWAWDYAQKGVTLGHYYNDNFEGAKEDFAFRSGLIYAQKMFTDEQLAEIARCCGDVLSGSYNLEDQQYKRIEDIQEQIFRIFPNQLEQIQSHIKTIIEENGQSMMMK